MRIHLLAVGTRMPGWVQSGFRDYAQRLPRHCALALREIPPVRRTRSKPAARAVAEEGKRLLDAVPAGARVIALSVDGEAWDTRTLAARLGRWMDSGSDPALLVGGADGLDRACLERAETRWSLSALTLPHALVRVLVAEQIYRAWTVLSGHPYHRE